MMYDSSYDDGTHTYIDDLGYKLWLKKKECHREDDKPAIMHENGYREWCLNGIKHRDNNQPSIIRPNGYREWWFKGFQISSPTLENYLIAFRSEKEYIKTKQFRTGINSFDIPLDIQEELINSDSFIAKYIRNLDLKYSHLIMGNKFGVFDDV